MLHFPLEKPKPLIMKSHPQISITENISFPFTSRVDFDSTSVKAFGF